MMEKFFGGREKNDKKAIEKDLEAAGVTRPEEWREASLFENNQEENSDPTIEAPSEEAAIPQETESENRVGRSPDDFLAANVEPTLEELMFPEEFITPQAEKLPEPMEFNKDNNYLIFLLQEGDIWQALEARKKTKLTSTELKSVEFVAEVCAAIKNIIEGNDEWNYKNRKMLSILKNFYVPKEQKIELGSMAIAKILRDIKDIFDARSRGEPTQIDGIQEIGKAFSLPESVVDKLVIDEICNSLNACSLRKAEKLKKVFTLSDDSFISPEASSAIEQAAVGALRAGYAFQLEDLARNFKISSETLESKRVTEEARTAILKKLQEGDAYFVAELKKNFPALVNTIALPEILDATLTGLEKNLRQDFEESNNAHDLVSFLKRIREAKDLIIIPKEKIDSPKVMDLAYAKFKWYVENGWKEGMQVTRDFFNFSEEKMNSSEILSAAYKRLLNNLERGWYAEAAVMKEAFPGLAINVRSKEVAEATAKILEEFFDGDKERIMEAVKVQKLFSLKPERLQSIASEAFLKRIRSGDFENAVLINKNFPVSEKELVSEETAELVSEKISACFVDGHFDDALELAVDFKFPQANIKTLAEEAVTRLVAEGKFIEDVSGNAGNNPGNQYIDENDEYYDQFDDDLIDSDDNGNNHGSATVESLLTKFPALKEYIASPVMEEKVQAFFMKSACTAPLQNLERMYERFTVYPETVQEAFRRVSSETKDFSKLLYLNDLLEVPLDPLLTKTLSIFGDSATFNNYKTLESIAKGETSEELELFGVKQGGQAGLAQLEQGFSKFRQDILRPDFDPHILKKSKMAASYFMKFVRFAESEWTGDGNSFKAMVNRYIELYDEGEYETYPLNENYTPSEVMYIDTVEADKKSFEYSEQFLTRFQIISDDLKKAKQRRASQFPLSSIISDLEKKVAIISEEMKSKVRDIPNEKGRQALAERVATLQSLKLRNLKDFEANFLALASLKELEPDLRQAMFVMGFAENKVHLNKDLSKINSKSPKLEDLTWVMNFVDHIVNKEVMSKYFVDKKARNKFRELINVRSFEEELSRFQNQAKTGKTALQFVPTRGLLMEFSGHIADTCWADKYDYTLPASFPNFTAISMVQNLGTRHERLCGSCMIIETREGKKDGEKILLIRGLNPIQNVVNNFSIDDFYKKFTSYVKGLAEKTGQKTAIVIDNHSGGSATNRPLLFNYLSHLKLEKVRVPYRETTFNNYDVTRNSFLI